MIIARTAAARDRPLPAHGACARLRENRMQTGKNS